MVRKNKVISVFCGLMMSVSGLLKTSSDSNPPTPVPYGFKSFSVNGHQFMVSTIDTTSSRGVKQMCEKHFGTTARPFSPITNFEAQIMMGIFDRLENHESLGPFWMRSRLKDGGWRHWENEIILNWIFPGPDDDQYCTYAKRNILNFFVLDQTLCTHHHYFVCRLEDAPDIGITGLIKVVFHNSQTTQTLQPPPLLSPSSSSVSATTPPLQPPAIQPPAIQPPPLQPPPLLSPSSSSVSTITPLISPNWGMPSSTTTTGLSLLIQERQYEDSIKHSLPLAQTLPPPPLSPSSLSTTSLSTTTPSSTPVWETHEKDSKEKPQPLQFSLIDLSRDIDIDLIDHDRPKTSKPIPETTARPKAATTTPKTKTTTTKKAPISENLACPCSCSMVKLKIENITVEVIQELTTSIQKNLTIDTSSLSSTLRKKTSAYDSRASSELTGMIGVACMALTFGSVILMDVVNLIQVMARRIIYLFIGQ